MSESLKRLIQSNQARLQQIGQAIQQSAAAYAKGENDLKQHLANHNAMLGAQQELQTLIATLTKELPEGEEANTRLPQVPEMPAE